MRAALRVAAAILLLAGVAAGAEPKRLRVAVLPFDSPSEDAQYKSLGAGMQAMLTTDLAATPQLQLVEREKLQSIQAELALGKGGAVDKATAVKVGKLLGASYLLTGALTIAGSTMRIDARLIDAATGEVVLADKAEGDKELFFELEKALAQKLIAALGTPLTPKERARLAKIHTADFDAFRRFSDGIAAFDHKAFDDARKALREALEKDEEFQLARLTLDDYEGIIAKLQARGDLLEAAERQKKMEARTARAVEQKLILDRLFTLSKSDDPDERLPAVYGLARWHSWFEKNDLELHLVEDAFLLARTCDALTTAYLAESEKVFPKVPLFGTRDFLGRPPREAKDLEEDQKRWLERFFSADGGSEVQVKSGLMRDIERGLMSHEYARRLHLDIREEARFAERVYKLGLQLDPDAVDAYYKHPQDFRHDLADFLGERYREAGLFDESTRWFAESGRLAHEPYEAERAAREVQKNRDIVKYLAEHKHALVHEYLMVYRYDLPNEWHEKDNIEELEAKPLGVPGKNNMAYARKIHFNRDNAYVLIGDRPLYPMDSTWLSTGKRTDPLRATDLDYYRKESKSATTEWWQAYFDGLHKGAMTARFAIGYEPDAEWWHDDLSSSAKDLTDAKFVTARPEVVFLFGVKDIDVPFVRTAEREPERMQRGLTGYGLKIGKDGIALVKVTEPEVRTRMSVERQRLSFEVLDDDGGAVKDGAKVVVTVKGREVSAKVGGLDVDATLDEVPAGFTGFGFLGAGHARIVGPVVTIGR